MSLARLRWYAAGLIALLIGIPLTEKALAQADDIVQASLDLAEAIADSAGNS